MWRFGLRRAGRLALGLLGAMMMAGVVATAAAPGARGGIAQFLMDLGGRFLGIVHLDFGTSLITGAPASALLAERLPATLELVAAGAIIAALVGVPLGILLSMTRLSRAAAPLVQVVAAAPVFCAGLALLWFSAVVLHWDGGASPARGLWASLMSGDIASLRDNLRVLALPALTVGAAGAASVQLALRRGVGEALDAPYRRGLKMMGLGGFEVDRLYFVPQVLAGVLASLGEITLSLFSAAAVAEWVFGWPGAAVLFLKSVALGDWSVVALVVFAFAAVTLFAEFAGSLGARALAGLEVGP